MTVVILLGPPGAGKGTQASRIAERLGIPAISTGDIFRANMAEGTEIGKQAQAYMDRGEFVPDSVTNAMVKARLAAPDAADGFLLDGYPRSLEQAHVLRDMLLDLGKSIDHEVEGTHAQIGADLAKKYRENNQIIHAIQAHHNDVEPQTLEAILVQAADAISAARPGARRETLENYIKRLEKLEEIANSFDRVDTSYAIQAGREVRIIVKPEKVSDSDTVMLAREIAKRIENEMEYPGQIKVNVIRETRTVDVAK